MAQVEIIGLMNTAVSVSAFHLRDALTRVRFQEEVKLFAKQQIAAINNSKDDKESLSYIQNIKDERDNLKIQDRMLRTGESVLTASVKIYQENGKIIGYIIDGIGIVLSGVQVVTGYGLIISSIPSVNPIGIVAGATLVMNGFASGLENIQKIAGFENPRNFVIDAYEGSAQFLGFDQRVGLLAYQVVDLSTSYYGVFRLALKPDAKRLWRYTTQDFYRKASTMGRAALAIKATSAGVKGIQIGNTLYEVQHSNN